MRQSLNSQVVDAPKRQRLAPDERRALILDAAQGLFFARGWDDVTVADVLTKAGISKGGFYHHFTAKEDLLDGVVERFTKDALNSAEAARAATSGNALVRFNAFLAETSRWKAEQGPQMKFFMDVMLRPGNDILFGRITSAASAAALPVLLDMIGQGVEDGTFDVPDVPLVGETIMAMSQTRRGILARSFEAARNDDLEQAVSLLDRRMVAEAALIDRMLGLPKGSILMTNPTEFRLMLRAIAWG
jgi:AcrR family transcriptional regulator